MGRLLAHLFSHFEWRDRASIELVEIPGVAELDDIAMQNDLAAVRDTRPDGLVLSWELWNIPLQGLELVHSALTM